MLKPSLCDYSDACILFKGSIIVVTLNLIYSENCAICKEVRGKIIFNNWYRTLGSSSKCKAISTIKISF